MKNLIFILFLFLSLSLKSQTLTQVVTGGSVGFTAGTTYVENGELKYLFIDDGTNKQLTAWGGIKRSSNHLSAIININAYILFQHPNGTVEVISNLVPFNQFDFTAPQGTATISVNKQFNVTIPSNFNQGGTLRMGFEGNVNSGPHTEAIVSDWEVKVILNSEITHRSISNLQRRDIYNY